MPELKWICIDCIAVDDIDFFAAKTLRFLQAFLKERNIRLILCSVSDDVKRELDRSGLFRQVGEEAFFAFMGDVLDACTRSAAGS